MTSVLRSPMVVTPVVTVLPGGAVKAATVVFAAAAAAVVAPGAAVVVVAPGAAVVAFPTPPLTPAPVAGGHVHADAAVVVVVVADVLFPEAALPPTVAFAAVALPEVTSGLKYHVTLGTGYP